MNQPTRLPKARPKVRRLKKLKVRLVPPDELTEEEVEEEDWAPGQRKELKPEDGGFQRELLLDGVSAEHSFNGVTIGAVKNQDPLPPIPIPYRFDRLADRERAPPNQQEKQYVLQNAVGTKDPARKELEELQIKTVVGLVDTVKVEVGGAEVKRKLLFLSNRQARMLPLDSVDRVMSGLDFFPRPKLVIQMFGSTAVGKGQYSSSELIVHHWGDCELQGHDLNKEHYFVSETDFKSAQETEFKIQAFLKECLLPLARQHNALIILENTECSLSRAFGRLCAAEAERRRGNLGFFVLTFINALQVLISSENPATVASRLRNASRNWEDSVSKMWYVSRKSLGAESAYHNHYVDAPDGCTHYIVVDCISGEHQHEWKRDWIPLNILRARMIQALLVSQIPGFAVSTLQNKWGLRSIERLADQVARGIPLLLLDSRDLLKKEEPITSEEDAILRLRKLEDSLNEEGTGNFYHSSTLAFLHHAMTDILHRDQTRHRRATKIQIGEDIDDKDGKWPLWGQIRKFERDAESLLKPAEEQSSSSMLKKEDHRRCVAEKLTREFLTFISQKEAFISPDPKYTGVSELPKSQFQDILMKMVGELVRCESKAMLDRFLQHYCLVSMSSNFAKKAARTGLFCVKHGLKDGRLFKEIIQLARKEHFGDAKDFLFHHLRDECLKFDSYFQRRNYLANSPEITAAFHEVLLSPLTHSANLSDLGRLQKLLTQMHVDRQMPEIGLTTCRLLQRAWVDVDVYHHVATRMKNIAKFSYGLVLLTGYAITILTLMHINLPDVLTQASVNYSVLGMSVGAGLISALISFLDPTTKWQQLRAAALAMEVEIWKFRCCAGEYSRDMLSNHMESIEETLCNVIAAIEDSVLKSAGISETSFLSTFRFSRDPAPGIYKHGQYKGAAWEGKGANKDETVDDHHSLLTAREYMDLRFHSRVRFYQQRLPRYARWHTMHQVLLAIASGLVTVLVYLGETQWCAVCTAGVAAATAWAEFNGTKKKMRMQQAASFPLLVQRSEECFASEHSSWVSSMSAQHGHRKTGNDEEDEKDKVTKVAPE
ncbi:Hypothetical protein (Fragment) [Durusdinium trenchii]|uniref:Uncharacterized protein n=1 Tax=Durusdinium trenchii TaxID=1381693 RepID=A0ABP0J0V1_9DINO